MNQQQYIRLSIVLAVPTLILSLYMGQQDVFYERGQFVQCSVSEAYCDAMISSSQQQSHRHLSYFVDSSNRFLGLYDIDVPIKVYFYTVDDKLLDVSSLVDGKILETSNCLMLPQNKISCSNEIQKVLPYLMSEGRIEFVNPEDELAFNNTVEEGESYFEDYTLNRIVEGFGLFLIFATPYLIFSWLVHYVIYGAKIGPRKKRPHQ